MEPDEINVEQNALHVDADAIQHNDPTIQQIPGDNLRSRLADAVSAPHAAIPALLEHDYNAWSSHLVV